MTPFFRLTSWFVGLLDLGFLLLKILGPIRPKFFRKGYGGVDLYWKRFDASLSAIDGNTYGSFIGDEDLEWGDTTETSGITIQEGQFQSPLSQELPMEAAFSTFHLVKPSNFSDGNAVYIFMLPATGEMNLGARLSMAKQLARQYGWSSVILTAPYYGTRKPKEQTLFFIDSVKDILLQSQAIIEESSVLAKYFLDKSAQSKVCFTGFSYGAAMASCASVFSLKLGSDGNRMACAAYVGSASPSCLADGILETSIDFDALDNGDNSKNSNDDREQKRKSLHKQFTATQLECVDTPPEQQMASVKGISMGHDMFIKKQYAYDLERQIRKCLYPKFEMQWIPGGHVWAFLIRPFLHKQLLIDTIQELQHKHDGQKTT